MTEMEKARLGLLYDANNDPQILADHDRTLGILYRLRMTDPREHDEINSLLESLLGSIKPPFTIEQPFFCGFGSNIFIGTNFYANYNCTMLDNARIDIGDNVFLAPGVGIYTAGHPLDPIERRNGLEYAKPVSIADDVWIGAGALILPGVSIGTGTVIGAGTVVTKSIPANVIAVGNPCRVIREIASQGSR